VSLLVFYRAEGLAMVRLSRFVLSHKLMVVGCWLVVLVAGAAASSGISHRLSEQVTLPGAAGYEANQRILQLYGNGGAGYPEVVAVKLPAGERDASASGSRTLARAFAAAAGGGGVRVADYANTANRSFLTTDPRLSYGLEFVPYAGEATRSLGPQITTAMTRVLPAGSSVQVTGMTELRSGGHAKESLGVVAETLTAGAGALLVLAFLFGSALALAPLLMAAVAIPATFLAVWALTHVTSVFFIVQYLVALIGLGVAIDYSLLLITRWREELAAGHDSHRAVERAMATAGRSIAFSGLTVALGLLTLVVLPVPLVRSIGLGGMLIPAVSVAATLTLLPVLLALGGERFDRPRRKRTGEANRRRARWAALVVRHRWAATLAALAVLAALGIAAAQIKIGEPTASALATTSQPAHTLRALDRAGAPAGVLDPIEVLAPASARPSELARRLSVLPGVRTAVAPTGPAWRRAGTALISVQPLAEPSTTAGAATIARVRALATNVPGAKVGGPGPLLLDENHAFYDSFPLLLGLLALITIILLARAFGSILLPIKALALNLASIWATYGVLVLVWQHGRGSNTIWGLPATGAITNWVPLVAFAFLYGLSMDYEVFIVTRIREERDRTASTTQGVIEGIARTGRLVTGAALCLFLALAALTTGPGADVKVMATALGAGVLLDATIVRGLLLPALIALLGRWNWWLPRHVAGPLQIPTPIRELERQPGAQPNTGSTKPARGRRERPATSRCQRRAPAHDSQPLPLIDSQETAMTITFNCPLCDQVITAEDEDELVAKVKEHAHDDDHLRYALSSRHILAQLRRQESA
jgi:putative drug exporter of the RND superfamily